MRINARDTDFRPYLSQPDAEIYFPAGDYEIRQPELPDLADPDWLKKSMGMAALKVTGNVRIIGDGPTVTRLKFVGPNGEDPASWCMTGAKAKTVYAIWKGASHWTPVSLFGQDASLRKYVREWFRVWLKGADAAGFEAIRGDAAWNVKRFD